eukprot:TRINITY_DN3386_c0_g1_i3.p1 TRINITY_DN3386_c0_g1~~TRINITY_DN3386_c0_g1_i3.p1  ORF type:complete len:359 (-),score=34.74 TRINITY_DN3386_c0_g1_i3:347-1423(-)
MPTWTDFTDFRNWPCVTATMNLSIFILLAFEIEKFAILRKITNGTTSLLHCLNITSCLIFPIIFTTIMRPHPVPALVLFSLNLILALKLISFAHVMRSLRFMNQKIRDLAKNNKNIIEFIERTEISQENLEVIRQSVDNPLSLLNMRHLLYFIAAPTLCYQLSYPKTPSIRKLWLLKRIIEFLLCSSLQLMIYVQFFLPLVETGLLHIMQGDTAYFFEKLLRIGIPTVYIWLLGFFGVFQVLLNITAELLRFADRHFYGVLLSISFQNMTQFVGVVELHELERILETLEYACSQLVHAPRLLSSSEKGSFEECCDADCLLDLRAWTRVFGQWLPLCCLFLGFRSHDEPSSDHDHSEED